RVSGPTFAVTTTGPARSPSVTCTCTLPVRSVVATAGSTVPPLAVSVTICPTNGAPVVSRTSSTSGTGSAAPAVPCRSRPCVNRVRPSDTTGRTRRRPGDGAAHGRWRAGPAGAAGFFWVGEGHRVAHLAGGARGVPRAAARGAAALRAGHGRGWVRGGGGGGAPSAGHGAGAARRPAGA